MSSLLARARFARALSFRPFALLWTGQTLSSMGDGAFFTVLSWQVLLLTGSAAALGLLVAAQTLPTLVFILIGGVTADRFSRRVIMIWSDVGRAIVVLIIAVLAWLHLLQFWHLIFLVIAFGTADGFFRPAFRSIGPELVDKEALSSANALNGLSKQANQLLGPILGAGLVVLVGTAGAFAFDGISFLCSVGSLLLLRPSILLTATSEAKPKAAKSGWQRFFGDAGEGLKYVADLPWLWSGILVASGIGIVVTGPLAVSLPKLVHDFYAAPVWLLGLINTGLAVGTIGAMVVMGQLHLEHRRGIILYTVLIIACASAASLGLPMPPFVRIFASLLGAIGIGIGTGVLAVIWSTLLQEKVPLEKLGRVSSVDTLGSFGLLPVGFIVVGLLADRFGANAVFLMGGLLGALFALLQLLNPAARKLD